MTVIISRFLLATVEKELSLVRTVIFLASSDRGRVWIQQNEFNPTAIVAPVPSQEYVGHWLVLVSL